MIKINAPIVIGAIGGSGTRVVAELIKKSGCFIGSNLNLANDNMDFAFMLTGDVAWLQSAFPFEPSSEEALNRLLLFEKLYFNNLNFPLDYYRVGGVLGRHLKHWKVSGLLEQPYRDRIRNFRGLFKNSELAEILKLSDKWGFKDCYSIFLMEVLKNRYEKLKFIHVIRDGRDMAMSGNQQQLSHFGPLFGIAPIPDLSKSFDFWSRVNSWASDIGEKWPDEQYLRVKFEDLCNNPSSTIDNILSFTELKRPLNIDINQIPKLITSMGRWQKQRHLFRNCDLSVLSRFGYV